MTNLTDIETELRIARLFDDYGHYLDRGDFASWINLFDGEDASYIIHPRENLKAGLEGYWMYCRDKPMIRDRLLALKNANIYNIHYDRHLISGIRIVDANNDTYDVRANYCVIQTDVEGRSEVFSVGEYRDKISVSDRNPRFKVKVVIPDTFNIQRPLAVPL